VFSSRLLVTAVRFSLRILAFLESILLRQRLFFAVPSVLFFFFLSRNVSAVPRDNSCPDSRHLFGRLPSLLSSAFTSIAFPPSGPFFNPGLIFSLFVLGTDLSGIRAFLLHLVCLFGQVFFR